MLCDTERNLFDWAQQGTFYLMGINEQVVFEPFPVEVSDGFNTIKVKTAVYEGADYFMGAGCLVLFQTESALCLSSARRK